MKASMRHNKFEVWVRWPFFLGVGLLGIDLLTTPVWVGAMDIGQAQAPFRKFQRADFGREKASINAREVADWALSSGDPQGMPFIVVDKRQARVFVFSRLGRFQGSAAALTGLTRGDESVPGIGDRPLSLIRPWERTTPSGRFAASLAKNVWGQDILWVDYEQGISLHPVRSVDPSERRLERLASPSAEDNRISFGCINVPTSFWEQVVHPLFQNTPGVVYVLPDTKALSSVFKLHPSTPVTP